MDHRYIGVEETAESLDAWGEEFDALNEHYSTEYQAYATRFTVAAQVLGHASKPPIDVRVIADTSPSPRWWDQTAVRNPTLHDSDPLAVAIWQKAHATVPLPNIGTRKPDATEHEGGPLT